MWVAFINPAHGFSGHQLSVLAFFLRFVINGKHTAVEFIVVAEEVVLQLFGVEPLVGVLSVLPLIQSPVELPACVGPQFVIASIGIVVDDEVGVASSVGHFHQLALHEVSLLVVEFHVEYTANLGGLSVVGLGGVGREPYCVADEVAGVVEMDIHLLLRQGLSEAFEMVHEDVHGGGRPFFEGVVDLYRLVGHTSEHLFFFSSLHDVGVVPEYLVESSVADAGQHVLARLLALFLVVLQIQIHIVHVVEYGLTAHVAIVHVVDDALHLRVAFVMAVVHGQVD